MQYDRLQKSLRRLGLNRANYKVLKLLPLVYVAWSDGRMSAEEEERIVELSHHHFEIGEYGEEVLRGWIRERPSAEYLHEGLRDILLLSRAPDEWGFDVDELQGLLAHAEAIARTSARSMDADAPQNVSKSEQEALRDIAKEFDIQHGESWAELLTELERMN